VQPSTFCSVSIEDEHNIAFSCALQMFDWLVACINAAIGEDKNCAASVGVLDIYGFESFASNDFEQVGGLHFLACSC